MGFELFTGKKTRSTEPAVTILKSGSLFFNSSCFSKYLKGNKFANLLFDKDNEIIGVQPTDKNSLYSYSIRESKNRTGCAVSTKSFFETYNVDYKTTRTYRVSWDEKLKIIEIKLKNPPAA